MVGSGDGAGEESSVTGISTLIVPTLCGPVKLKKDGIGLNREKKVAIVSQARMCLILDVMNNDAAMYTDAL